MEKMISKQEVMTNAVYTRTHQPKVNQTNDNQKNTAKNDKTKKKKPTAKELNALMEKIDYDYLNAMCIYLPVYDSADDLSENNLAGIYLTAMSRKFDLNYGDKYHSEDIHEGDFPLSESQIIPEDQIVSEDNQKASFKKECFDKFNTIAGITKDPTKVDFSTVDSEQWLGEEMEIQRSNIRNGRKRKETGSYSDPSDRNDGKEI